MNLRWLPLIVLLLALCSCHAGKQRAGAPRPERGYLHWLERQSLFGQSGELLAQVSQTGRLWSNSGAGGRWDALLEAAPAWLEINPGSLSADRPLFRALSADMAQLPALGFQGLYFGDVGERAEIWLEQGGRKSHAGAPSFSFAQEFGADEAFDALAQKAEEAGAQLGADLLPASTARGPDFLLQARSAPESAGIYAMLPVERADWPLLPRAENEWDALPLDAASQAALARAGVIPEALARDGSTWNTPGGWAATGEIMGIDGQPRRWVYRYDGDPRNPVFSWTDPAARAARIFSAAVILQTGLRGLSLVGLRLEPLMGLEPAGENPGLSPGLEALEELSRQIHRYGGWALQADSLPEGVIGAVLAGPCDFCRDEPTALAAARAIMEKSAGPLASLYGGRLKSGLDVSRLARGFNVWSAAEAFSRGGAVEKILTHLSLGLPGLAFVDSRLLAPLFMPSFYQSSAGEQAGFARELKNIALARDRHGLARGRFVAALQSPDGAALALASELPSGGFWLVAINFGGARAEIAWTAPRKLGRAVEIGPDGEAAIHVSGGKMRLALDGWQCRNIVFFKD